MIARTRARRTNDLKRSILNSLLRHGATSIMTLMYEAEVNHKEIKRLTGELMDAELIYTTTADKAPLPLTEKQHGRALWPEQKLFIITDKGRRCAKLMNQNTLRI